MILEVDRNVIVVALQSTLVAGTYDDILGYQNLICGLSEVKYGTSGGLDICIALGPGTALLLDINAGILRVCAQNISATGVVTTPSACDGCEDVDMHAITSISVTLGTSPDTVTIGLC
jgi:hypothetical protein